MATVKQRADEMERKTVVGGRAKPVDARPLRGGRASRPSRHAAGETPTPHWPADGDPLH